jgi:pyruvate dehydrogenase E2 component (dihydrolipoyllysine-residue acetyltransferase)
MRSIENTAVNDLVARAHDKALDTSHGTMAATMPASMPGSMPGSMPVAAPFEDSGAGAAHAWAVAVDGYIAESPTWTQKTAQAPRRAPSPRRLHELMSQRLDGERMVPTFQMRRHSEVRSTVGRLALPVAVLVSTGVVIGAYVAFSGSRRAPVAAAASAARAAATPARAASAAPVAPAPVAAASAAVAPAVAAPAPAATRAAVVAPAPPALVDVRIDSTPSGATVTLVDRGRTQLVGTTPVDAAVDPSREYDLVFSYAAGPPRIEHLDARSMHHIEVALGEPAPAPAMPAAPAPRAARTESAPSHAARVREPVAEGTLMISSKPPCEIAIDGRATGLTTPQRAIALPAGSHRITLRNAEKSIRKSLTVQIAPNATEKVIEDLMK